METFSIFGLNAQQTEILYELERRLVQNDIRFSEKKSDQKTNWLTEWNQSIELYFNETLNIKEIRIFNKCSDEDLCSHIKNDSGNNVWKYMVLLECVLFQGYFPFKKEDIKRFKGLKMAKKPKREMLERIAKEFLFVDPKYITTFERAYDKSIKRMSNFWIKVSGVAAVVTLLVLIAILTQQYEILLAFFAKEGTFGASVISSGLAALGGGAIAAGGYGVAAGTVVYVGGGILLGTAVGVPSGLLVATATNSKLFLSQAAKMEVVLKEIVLAIQKDTAYFQKIMLNLYEQTANLTTELQQLKMKEEDNKRKIKELKKSLQYLESVIGSVQK